MVLREWASIHLFNQDKHAGCYGRSNPGFFNEWIF